MPLIHLTVDVSEEVLEVLRWICAEGKSSAPCKDDLLDEFARSRLRACEHGGFVQVNDRVFLTPMGRLVLAAHDAQEQEDKWAIIEKAEDAAGGVFAGGLLNDLGADFAPDAPDPVGKVVEAARVYMSAQDDWANSLAYGVGHLTDRLEAGLQDARRNLRKVLDELDRATGKAGEVGS